MSAHTEDIAFEVGGNRLAGTRVLPAGGSEPGIMHLHGLGTTATRHGIRYLLDDLAEHGHGSLTFEFSGNGDSSGTLDECTLGRRLAESRAAAAHLGRDEAPVLIGTSMGAHLAATLVPELRPRTLVLFAPAAYPAGCDDVRFGGTRPKPDAYADSPAFAGIRRFDGDLLIVAGRRDHVVPHAVVDHYLASASSSRSTKVFWFDCDHFIHRWLPGEHGARADVRNAILRVIEKGCR